MTARDAGWQEVELSESRAAQLAREYGGGIAQHWKEFDTNNPEELAELTDLVMRPLPHLLVLPGVDPSWRVLTTIPNHHRGLNPRITFASVTTIEDDKTCHVTLAKKPGPSEGETEEP